MQREYDQLSPAAAEARSCSTRWPSAAELRRRPRAWCEAEFDQIWQRLEADRKAGKLDDEDKDKDEETLKAEYRAIAERRVRLGLLLAEIGRANSITVTADEMTRAMRAEALRYPGQEAQVMEFFRKNPQATENLRGPIFEEKVVDFMLRTGQGDRRRRSRPEELAKEPRAAGRGRRGRRRLTPDRMAGGADGWL